MVCLKTGLKGVIYGKLNKVDLAWISKGAPTNTTVLATCEIAKVAERQSNPIECGLEVHFGRKICLCWANRSFPMNTSSSFVINKLLWVALTPHRVEGLRPF